MEQQETRQRKTKTFAEIEIPATEHAKELAKANSAKKVLKKKEVYTIENGKVLLVTVKENGNVYHTYIGREESVSKDQIKQWQKAGRFIYPHQIDEIKSDFMKAIGKE
jgi:hypothetical protein